jgi:hypothetical protein
MEVQSGGSVMKKSIVTALEMALQETYQVLDERGVVLSYEDECWLIEQECRRLLGQVSPEDMN